MIDPKKIEAIIDFITQTKRVWKKDDDGPDVFLSEEQMMTLGKIVAKDFAWGKDQDQFQGYLGYLQLPNGKLISAPDILEEYYFKAMQELVDDDNPLELAQALYSELSAGGFNLHNLGVTGCSLLHIFAHTQHQDTIKFLMGKGFNMNSHDSWEISPIYLLFLNRDKHVPLAFVKWLADQNVNFNQHSENLYNIYVGELDDADINELIFYHCMYDDEHGQVLTPAQMEANKDHMRLMAFLHFNGICKIKDYAFDDETQSLRPNLFSKDTCEFFSLACKEFKTGLWKGNSPQSDARFKNTTTANLLKELTIESESTTNANENSKEAEIQFNQEKFGNFDSVFSQVRKSANTQTTKNNAVSGEKSKVTDGIFDDSFHLENNNNDNFTPQDPALPTTQSISSEVPKGLLKALDGKEIKIHQCTHLNVNNQGPTSTTSDIPKARL